MTSPAAIPTSELALQRLYHWERTKPNELCMTQPIGGGKVREYTWSQMMLEVRRMAAHIRSLGLEPGAKIALLSKNCAHWMMADFAIWMAGGVSVPLYPTLAAETVRQILVHSESKLLFVGKLDEWDAMAPGVPQDLACISMPLAPPTKFPTWDDIVARTPPLQGEPVRGADELSTIIYTSGTTGMPKGVMQTFGKFAWAIESGLKRANAQALTRVVSYLPLAHVAERSLIEHGMLAVGWHVFFCESLDTFTTDLQRARPTLFFSVPRLWVKFQQGIHAKMPPAKLQLLLKIPIINSLVRKKILRALGLDQCQFACGGAAPMPPNLLRWWSQLGLQINEVYGMTENCAVSHSTVPGLPRPGTVGIPFDKVQCRIDPNSGEIQMRSPGLMLGYYKEPELTKQAFTEDGWLRTGDKGEVDAEGNLRITGRIKDLFKTSKGKYVSPSHIEEKLGTHPAIEACCVSGANLSQPLGILMLSAIASEQARNQAARVAMEAEFATHLRQINKLLDPHEQMDCLVVVRDSWTVESGFITPTLKVKRHRIEEAYSKNFAGWVETRRPVVWHQY